jgi:hypothetical protein
MSDELPLSPAAAASTSFSCLVQPAGCNPAKKKAVQTQGQGRQVPNEKRFKIAKKNLQDSVVRPLDSEPLWRPEWP